MRKLETYLPRYTTAKRDRWDYLSYPFGLMLIELVVDLNANFPIIHWISWALVTSGLAIFYSLQLPAFKKWEKSKTYSHLFDFSLVLITLSIGVACASLLQLHSMQAAGYIVGAATFMGTLESISSYPSSRSYRSYYHYLAITGPVALALISYGNWTYPMLGIAVIFQTMTTFNKERKFRSAFFEMMIEKVHVESSEKRMRNFINMLPGYVSWLDQDLKYRGINKQLEDLIGKSEAQVMGESIGQFKDTSPFVRKIHDFMMGVPEEDFCEMDFDFEGNPKWYLVLMKKVRIEEKLEILVITLDIDAQKQSQFALEEQRAFAEHSSRLATLGEMAAGIAHEIRNPLTVIGTAADTLMIGLEKGIVDKEKIIQRVTLINNTVERINAIVKSLGNFSRANNDEDPMGPALLNDLLEEALVLCKEKVVKAGVTLKTSNETNCLIACHPHQIGQIFVNLIGNACDATTSSEIKEVLINVHQTHEFVRIEVWDSGPGLKDPNKLFKPFHTTKGVGKGTGLGLIISKRLVERHQGQISYLRENNRTCFCVQIPYIKNGKISNAA